MLFDQATSFQCTLHLSRKSTQWAQRLLTHPHISQQCSMYSLAALGPGPAQGRFPLEVTIQEAAQGSSKLDKQNSKSKSVQREKRRALTNKEVGVDFKAGTALSEPLPYMETEWRALSRPTARGRMHRPRCRVS